MNKVLASIDKALAGLYETAELESVKKALCLELLGINRISYYTKEVLAPDAERDSRLENALTRLAKGEPLQYVLGYSPFCGYRALRRPNWLTGLRPMRANAGVCWI